MNNNPQKNARIISLDVLRILAIISVLGVHQFSQFLLVLNSNLQKQNLGFISFVLTSYFAFGLTGVCIFFFVSGYAITIASLNESPKSFAWRRILRIFPIYFLASILEFLINFQQNVITTNTFYLLKSFLVNLVMIGDIFNIPPNISGVAWTLRIEILFYFLVWCSMLIEKKINHIVITRMLILTLGMFLFSIFNFPTGMKMGNYFYVGMFFPILVAGSCFAFYKNNDLRKTIFFSLIFISIFIHLKLANTIRPDFFNDGNYFVASITIIVIVLLTPQNFKYASLILKCSQATFSFYLFHTFLVSYLIMEIKSFLPSVNFMAELVITLCSTLIVVLFSFTIYAYLEKPIIVQSKRIATK